MIACRCPYCSADLRRTMNVDLYEITPADANPEADLVFSCGACRHSWNVYVAVSQVLANPIEEAA